MSINKIVYSDKSDINTTAVANENKISASDMNQIKDTINANAELVGDGSLLNTTASTIVGAINEVRDDLYIEKVLWTNGDPSVSFTGGHNITMSESLVNFDYYEVLFLQSTTVARVMTTGRIPVGNGTILSYVTTVPFFRPTTESVTGVYVMFEDAKNLDGTINNTGVIPYIIKGIKRIGDD